MEVGATSSQATPPITQHQAPAASPKKRKCSSGVATDVGQIATQHIIQTARDWWSSVGNFFQFVVDMEALLVCKLDIAFLWSYPQVHGWISWTNKQVSGSTKWNKTLHLISLLKWLDSKSLIPAAAARDVTRCLTTLCAFAEQGKQQYNRSVTKAMNNNKLVAAGTALHSDERPTFILWLLDCVERCSAPFRESLQDAPAPATAKVPKAAQATRRRLAFQLQCYIQVLMEVFNGGYQWEIVAGLCVDRLKWSTTMNTIKATIPTEKLTRFKTNKVPLSSSIKHFVEFFIQHVRPVLHQPAHQQTGAKPLLALWINTCSQPLQFNSYTQGVKG